MGWGTGELSSKLGAFCISTSPPLLLLALSLFETPFSCLRVVVPLVAESGVGSAPFSLLLPLPPAEAGAESVCGSGLEVTSSGLGLGGAVQRGRAHVTPVKLLS